MATIPLGDVQRNGAESPPKLLAQIPVTAPNTCNDRPKDFDGQQRDFEDVKRGGAVGWF
ncbi:hypothetical protein LZC95_39070 [Pendulispora brunnea]|uniref:Uncharacterized protein n=1 Tax=Pendulispora brunnea TaxID=2905690 RepID=A0ABZ2K4G4_9BACT